jgi:glycosyltransferase involved in cell wall biosynthesis
MTILLLSRYGRLGASSRVRSYQYLPYLASEGIEVTIAPLLPDSYLRRLYTTGRKGIGSTLRAYAQRLRQFTRAREFDLLWVEYEIFPWLPFCLEEWLTSVAPPYIVDYDDAIYYRYNLHSNRVVRALYAGKIEEVMRRARLVIAGNEYLAEHARAAGARCVAYIPTVVDTERYQPAPRRDAATLTIGWMGSPVTARNLSMVAPALRHACEAGWAKVVFVGAGAAAPQDVPAEVRRWTEITEISDIGSFDIGIMPLPDEPFERGKCGYKLIQYMACAVPVIASPVGANTTIVENGVNGFLTTNTNEWLQAISVLRDNPELRRAMGAAGRKKVEKEYSLRAALARLTSSLRSAVEDRAGASVATAID